MAAAIKIAARLTFSPDGLLLCFKFCDDGGDAQLHQGLRFGGSFWMAQKQLRAWGIKAWPRRWAWRASFGKEFCLGDTKPICKRIQAVLKTCVVVKSRGKTLCRC